MKDNNLDKKLADAINSGKVDFDFEKWQQKYPEALKALHSNSSISDKQQLTNFNLWTIIMRSPITKLAASAAVIAVATFFFLGDGQESLYAKAMKAFEQARTIHIVLNEQRGQNWHKDWEVWYDRQNGVREEERFENLTQIRIDNSLYEWRYKEGEKIAAKVRSYRKPINEFTGDLYSWLRFNPQRDPAGDKVINGTACEKYVMTTSSAGTENAGVWVDKNNLVMEIELVEQRNGQEIRSLASIEYDVAIDESIFSPDFGPDVEIVEPLQLIEKEFSLDTAIYKHESLGFVFAVHKLEKLDNGTKFLVCSNRLSSQTRQEVDTAHPWTYYGGFNLQGFTIVNKHYVDASNTPLLLARMKHDGIQIDWYVLVPDSDKAKSCDVEVTIETANQLEIYNKSKGLPASEKFILDNDVEVNPNSSLTLKEAVSEVFSLGENFEPIVHSFLLTKLETKDGKKSIAWKKPLIDLSEADYLNDVIQRAEEEITMLQNNRR